MSAALIKNRKTDNVRRQQIRCKLDALKRKFERTRQRIGKRRFANAGNVFNQQMSFGKQGNKGKSDSLRFALDNALNRRLQVADFRRRAQRRCHRCRNRFGFLCYPISHYFFYSELG